jgi:hypothetical protein
MAPENYDGMTDKELIEHVWGTVPQHPTAVSVDRLLRWRQAEREAEGSNAMVAATETLVATTEKLVTATKRLGTVTWWLMFSTVLLVVVAAAQAVAMFMGAK